MIIKINLNKADIDKLYMELKAAKFSDGDFGFPMDYTKLIIYNPKLLTNELFLETIGRYGIKVGN